MARLLLVFLVAASLFATLAMARQFPDVVRTTAIQLDRPSVANPPSSSGFHPTAIESRLAGSPHSSRHARHRPFDKTLAGGKIILGGLAAAIFAAVFCYIRITKRRSVEQKS